MFFSIYPNGHNFLMQSQVIVKLKIMNLQIKLHIYMKKKLVSRKISFLSRSQQYPYIKLKLIMSFCQTIFESYHSRFLKRILFVSLRIKEACILGQYLNSEECFVRKELQREILYLL